MGLKLFRHTGHSSLLDTRAAALAWKRQSSVASGWNPLGLLIIVSLWLATVCNYALWRELSRLGQLQSVGQILFVIGFAIIIFAAHLVVFSLLAWRWSIKPLLIFLLFVAALGAHFMTSYSVVIDTTMMANVLQTDPRETRDLLNLKLLGTVLLLAVLPTWWLLRQRLRSTGVLRQGILNALFLVAACALLALTLGVFYQTFASLMRNQTHVRFLINPLNSVYALAELAAKPLQRGPQPLTSLGTDAQLGASYATPANKPPLVVLVVGETARVGNFSINGYARPTTPELAKLMMTERMATLRNVWSCGTNTAASLPCMFSHLGKVAFESSNARFENLLDVLQRAGLAVLWVDNQSGCKGLCDRVASADTTAAKDPELCKGGECFDAIMLSGLDARIAALPADKRAKGVVVVMHTMGSHGPAYYKRVPEAFKRFKPECATNALQDCTRDQMVNSYDNTIAYTDYFVASTINWLKNKVDNAQAAMIYLADHGESLGENNLYLHGLPYAVAPDVQKRVPWITWLSAGFAQRSRVNTTCLQGRADERMTHDNYFHSVLGLLDVRTSVYRPELDIYSGCVK